MTALARILMGSCEETGELLSAHLEDEVPPARRGRVRRHLALCSGCRAVYRSLERVVNELQTLRQGEPVRFPSVADAVVARLRRDELGVSR